MTANQNTFRPQPAACLLGTAPLQLTTAYCTPALGQVLRSPSTNRFCPSPPTHVTSLAGDTDSKQVGVGIHRTEGT